ncbi:MAG: ftsH3 2 [Planctomycetaceae bacterium]|nr:ftsH3 2 [Planctomycetaceae bacterium]
MLMGNMTMQADPSENEPPGPVRLDADGYFQRGMQRAASGDANGGIADFDLALKLRPEFVDALLRRGTALHFWKHDFERARQDFTEAIRIDPTNATAFRQRGNALVELGLIDEALADFSELIRLQPDQPVGHACRGVTHHRRKDFRAAITDYCTSIRLNPDPRILKYRAQCYFELEAYDAAITDYSAILKLQPDSVDALKARGSAAVSNDDLEFAVVDYTEVIRLAPDDHNGYLQRGHAWYRLQEYPLAIADYDQAIRLNPSCAEAYQYRGQCWTYEHEAERAIPDLDEAIRLSPEKAEAYRGRGRAWDKLEEFTKADADFETAEELELRDKPMMPERKTVISQLLLAHFDPIALDQLTITERAFPLRVRADLQRAIETLTDQMKVLHFCGVRKQYAHQGVNFTALIVRDRNDPAIAVPPQFEELDIGEEQPVRCLKEGLWLLEASGQRFAVFLEPQSSYHRTDKIRYQVATCNDALGIEIATKFLKHLESAVEEARSYRGKILSFELDERYSGTSTGIKVHKLRTVQREQVILPRRTLELLERNVIQFVRRRAKLAEMGMSTKKGLLFYGPPGTGKTHTIHYLASALPDTTTLLISAEQVGLLGEYMTLARLLQPSMVVIEDADLIARERSSMDSACEEVMLNKLLNEMDGLKEDADILFVLTTNRPEALEAALSSRPGRIDQAIEFPHPDAEGRSKLVTLYSRSAKLSKSVVESTVKKTAGVSAAFIKELMRRASQFLLEREGAKKMTIEDIDNALQELLFSGGTLNRKMLGGQIDEAEVAVQ